MAEEYTASVEPGAVGLLFRHLECLGCSLEGDTAVWRFRGGLELTLSMPDESQRRYKPHWHIGIVAPSPQSRTGGPR